MRSQILLVSFCLSLFLATPLLGQEPRWSGDVFARGRYSSLPMTHRPYRPFHIYGNTVRRAHYRGTAMPAPRDFFRGLRALRNR